MQLHLVVPGLLWPRKIFRDTTSALDLPALSWMLGRGHASWRPPCSTADALCHAFGLDSKTPPHAALRLLGEGGAPGDAVWLCADPVHLSIGQNRMTLDETAAPARPEEILEIVAALAPHFAEVGELIGGAAAHCYLRLKQNPGLLTTPPTASAGHAAMLPQGADAPRWRQLANEAQMLLHTLPCNKQREANGQARLNSLWFWGPGALPTGAAFNPGHQPERIIGSDPILSGLARLAGRPIEQASQPDALLGYSHGHTLLLLDTLQASACAYDTLGWREALRDLEHRWLQPMLAALREGRLKHLHLSAPGDEATLDLALAHSDRLRFWRRPRALYTMSPPNTESKSENTP